MAEERNVSSSGETTSFREFSPPPFDGISMVEPTELQYAPTRLVGPSEIEGEGEPGDYPAVHNFGEAKRLCWLESSKLWAIAGPIAFNIWCNYGMNSFTNIFVGHLGDVELSSVAVSLSVIANFSFGFLVNIISSPVPHPVLNSILNFFFFLHYC